MVVPQAVVRRSAATRPITVGRIIASSCLPRCAWRVSDPSVASTDWKIDLAIFSYAALRAAPARLRLLDRTVLKGVCQLPHPTLVRTLVHIRWLDPSILRLVGVIERP